MWSAIRDFIDMHFTFWYTKWLNINISYQISEMRPMNFGRLLKKLTTEKDQVEFLQEHGILKQPIDCVGCS